MPPAARLALRSLRSGTGPVAQPVFKTGEVVQPTAGWVRLPRRSVRPNPRSHADSPRGPQISKGCARLAPTRFLQSLVAFASASETTKYAATSIGSGKRWSMTLSSSIGTADRRVSVRRAGPSPPSERMAGWMPREISRSSSMTPGARPQPGRTSPRAPQARSTRPSAARDRAKPAAAASRRGERMPAWGWGWAPKPGEGEGRRSRPCEPSGRFESSGRRQLRTPGVRKGQVPRPRSELAHRRRELTQPRRWRPPTARPQERLGRGDAHQFGAGGKPMAEPPGRRSFSGAGLVEGSSLSASLAL
jgi:hypothetical protein